MAVSFLLEAPEPLPELPQAARVRETNNERLDILIKERIIFLHKIKEIRVKMGFLMQILLKLAQFKKKKKKTRG
ncbi:hypothetical protein [Avibacterium volantium]|uniref:hypothetical protein n=1 Tax=Avibacterium TaxID=292486 RepID=UPI003BF7EB46